MSATMLHQQPMPSVSGRSTMAPTLPAQLRPCFVKPQPHRHRLQALKMSAGSSNGGFLGGLFGGGNKQQQQQTQDRPGTNQQRPQQQSSAALQPEFPPYSVVEKGPVYSLRFYDVYTAVTTQYSRREEGYLALGRYVDGANADGVKFAYTQPVVMRHEPNQGPKVMQMYIGSRRDGLPAAAAPPAPTDAGVVLEAAGGELVAVLQFEGFITPASAEDARRRLITALQADGLALAEPEARGVFRVAQYGAVYTLEQRLNEVMLRVAV